MKALIHSKVFWLAVLQALVGVVVVFATAYPDVGFLVLAKSGLDILLRIYTTTEVKSILPAEQQ